MTVGIAYVDGPRWRPLYSQPRMGSAGREEINRIKRVPRTRRGPGTNFSLTFAPSPTPQSAGDARFRRPPAPCPGRRHRRPVIRDVLAPLSAGLPRHGRPRTATAHEITQAIKLDPIGSTVAGDPREGTILTVARDAAIAAEPIARESRDICEFMKRLLEEGEAALARTPDLLAVLKEAGVVDAGGKGFVRMLEGVVRYIHGDPILAGPAMDESEDQPMFAAAGMDVAAERDFQYCTEVLVRGEDLPRPTRCGRLCMPSWLHGGGYRAF